MELTKYDKFFLYIVFFLIILLFLMHFKNYYDNEEPFINENNTKHCIFDYVHYYEKNGDHIIEVKEKNGDIKKDIFKSKDAAFDIWNKTLKIQANLVKDCILIDLSDIKKLEVSHNNIPTKTKAHIIAKAKEIAKDNKLSDNECIFDYVHYYTENNNHVIEVKNKHTNKINKAYFTNKNKALYEWNKALETEKHLIKNCILIDLTKNNEHKMNYCPYEYIYYYKKNNVHYIELKEKISSKISKFNFESHEEAMNFYNKWNVCKLENKNTIKHITNLNHENKNKNEHEHENKPENENELIKSCKLDYAKLYNNSPDNFVLEIKKINKTPVKHLFKTYKEAKKLWDFLVVNIEFKNCILQENIKSNELINLNIELNKLNNKLLKLNNLSESDNSKLDILLNKFLEHSNYISEQHKKLAKTIKQNNIHKEEIHKLKENPKLNKSNLIITTKNNNSLEQKLKDANMKLVKNDIKITELENKLKENIEDNENNMAIIAEIYAKLLNNYKLENKESLNKIKNTLNNCPKCNNLPMPLYPITNPVSVMEIDKQTVGSIIKERKK